MSQHRKQHSYFPYVYKGNVKPATLHNEQMGIEIQTGGPHGESKVLKKRIRASTSELHRMLACALTLLQ